MTSPEAAKRYENEHKAAMTGRAWVVFNPKCKPVGELPAIYGFNNGGPAGWMHAVLIAENGTVLGGHICSSEAYMEHDLGIIEGTRADRHETFRKHYPEGYRMEFVSSDKAENHEGLLRAIQKNGDASKI